MDINELFSKLLRTNVTIAPNDLPYARDALLKLVERCVPIETDRYVVDYLYGLRAQPDHTTAECARKFHVNPTTIARRHKKVLRLLQQHVPTDIALLRLIAKSNHAAALRILDILHTQQVACAREHDKLQIALDNDTPPQVTELGLEDTAARALLRAGLVTELDVLRYLISDKQLSARRGIGPHLENLIMKGLNKRYHIHS